MSAVVDRDRAQASLSRRDAPWRADGERLTEFWIDANFEEAALALECALAEQGVPVHRRHVLDGALERRRAMVFEVSAVDGEASIPRPAVRTTRLAVLECGPKIALLMPGPAAGGGRTLRACLAQAARAAGER